MAFVDQFPKEDVTYKGARFQGDWEKESDDSGESKEVPSGMIPKSVTIESAIMFFENHAEGDYKNMYLQTSIYLRELLALKAKA